MKGKWIAGGVVMLAGVGAALGCFWPWRQGPRELRLPGVVETQEVRLASKVGGRVEKVGVREGDVVEAETPLIWLAVPELKAQMQQWQARLQAAEAELEKARTGARPEEKEAARAAVSAAEARWKRIEAGARPEEIRHAESELKHAEADRKVAREKLARLERIRASGGTSQQEHDELTAARNRAVAMVATAQARLDLLHAGSRVEEKAEAAAELKRVRANLDLIEAGTRSEDIVAAEARVAELRARLRELEVNLKEAAVIAPERAVVEVVAVRVGDVVAPNQPVVRALRADDLWVKVYVPETELGKVRLNQPCTIQIDSHPGQRFTGTVMQIASISEFTPRNVQSADERRHQVFGVKVRVDNAEGIFKSGMAAEVYLPVAE